MFGPHFLKESIACIAFPKKNYLFVTNIVMKVNLKRNPVMGISFVMLA